MRLRKVVSAIIIISTLMAGAAVAFAGDGQTSPMPWSIIITMPK